MRQAKACQVASHHPPANVPSKEHLTMAGAPAESTGIMGSGRRSSLICAALGLGDGTAVDIPR